MAKRKSLGRGLDALLSTEIRPNEQAMETGLKEIPVEFLQRGRYQPRLDMREESLEELANTIRSRGLFQPIVVRPLGSGAGESQYEIVAGERRWRAAQLAGLQSVPALVKDITDQDALEVALIENIQREDLNALEEARAFKRLVVKFDMTHGEVADAVGRSRASVSNLMRLLELPDTVKNMLERRQLDMGHARALLSLDSAEAQAKLATRVIKEGLSVRETERAVKRLSQPAGQNAGSGSSASKDPNVARLEMEIGEKLGAPVRIETQRVGGRIVIRYHSLEELEGIVEHID